MKFALYNGKPLKFYFHPDAVFKSLSLVYANETSLAFTLPSSMLWPTGLSRHTNMNYFKRAKIRNKSRLKILFEGLNFKEIYWACGVG